MAFKKLKPLTKMGPVPAALADPLGWLYFDIETSGLDHKGGDILSFGWAFRDEGGTFYNKNGMPTAETLAINGIDEELLEREGLPEAEFYAAILSVLRRQDVHVLCGYNQDSFDALWLGHKIGPDYQAAVSDKYGVDLMTVAMDKRVMGFWPGRKRLVDLYWFLLGGNVKDAHGALVDCQNTRRCAVALFDRRLLSPWVEQGGLEDALAVLNNEAMLHTWARIEQAMALVKSQPPQVFGDWVVTEKVSEVTRNKIPKTFVVPESWKSTYTRATKKLRLGVDTAPQDDDEEGSDE